MKKLYTRLSIAMLAVVILVFGLGYDVKFGCACITDVGWATGQMHVVEDSINEIFSATGKYPTVEELKAALYKKGQEIEIGGGFLGISYGLYDIANQPNQKKQVYELKTYVKTTADTTLFGIKSPFNNFKRVIVEIKDNGDGLKTTIFEQK